MNHLQRAWVWLSRIHRCRGFGIQSPRDYQFVRYVVNEHWPYYAYEQLKGTDWLSRKLGRLYFRLANWRQPTVMPSDAYEACWQAGCRRVRFLPVQEVGRVELARMEVEDVSAWEQLAARCDERSVIVVEGIWRHRQRWDDIRRDERTGTTFDLYYCGIVFFDKKRYKHNYMINF